MNYYNNLVKEFLINFFEQIEKWKRSYTQSEGLTKKKINAITTKPSLFLKQQSYMQEEREA